MAAATVIFILYAVSGGNLPDFTALAAFQSKAACVSAAADVTKALGSGQYAKMLVCLSSDSLNEIASKNEVGK
jgi:hypothetical protein